MSQIYRSQLIRFLDKKIIRYSFINYSTSNITTFNNNFLPVLILELRQYPFFVQERGIVLDKFRFKIIKLRTINGNDKKKRCSSKNVFLKPQFVEDVLKF